MKIIKNGLVLDENFVFEQKDILIEDGKIVSVASDLSGGEVIDASGCYVLPGLVNIHTHGAVGYDTSCGSYEGIDEMSKYWAKTGTTSFLPTTTTLLYDDLKSNMQMLAASIKRGASGAKIAGINMEGPYLSASHKGAHRADWLRSPDECSFEDMQKAADGNIKLVTLAPEIDGALDFVKKYSDSVCISLGHTGANYEQCMEAFKYGAKHVTHLFNAMPSIHHRNLSLIAAAFESGANVELIGDGLHVKKQTAMMAYKIFGKDKMILINDSMNAAGLGEGEYDFCGYHVFVKDGVALQDDGTICGGIAPLWDCVKNMYLWGAKLEDAVKMASYNPAKAIGLENSIGSIKEGKAADIIIASKDLEINDVLIDGTKIDF